MKSRAIISESIEEIHAKIIQALQASNEVVQIFSVSLADIQKVLIRKEYRDPAQYASDWLMPVINAFNRQDAKTLPPHRKGIDHEINFVEGKTNDDVSAMPLYQMSKDQLLVLRKTLTELLDNGFIRVSNSPAAAPVIFVKKPGGYLLNGLVGRSQLGNHCNNSKRRRHWMHMSVYYMILDLSYLGTALLFFIRDHKERGERGNCDGPRPYSIARPYTRLQLT